jgi:Spy/CpxP family protein refolding chaperone
MKLGLSVLALVAMGGFALAQHQHGTTPYAGLQQRTVKALSDRQLADLRAGRGMGLALAAELNGYPGPIHVLELADRLQLSDEQRQRMHALTEAMKAEAVPVGEKLIERERALDQAFAQREITPTTLAALTAQIGETQGELRAVHLKYHLTTAELLSPHQRHRYAELRGYSDTKDGHHRQ